MKDFIKQVIKFIWYDDSMLSWIVNILIAFILVKFVIYPLLGLFLVTSHPLVAVISGSMEHDLNFDQWWEENKNWYESKGISKEEFKDFSMMNGFNKGDIILLKGSDKYEVGDVVVYVNPNHPNPIIHRIVETSVEDGKVIYITKGDNNAVQDPFEVDNVIGEASVRIPLLGWVKIIFTTIINRIVGGI